MLRSSVECLLHCTMNEECRSINYQYTLDLTGISGLCEINSATLESCPRQVVKSVGHGYYRDITTSSKVLYNYINPPLR